MSSKIKAIIISAIVLVLLIGAVVALKVTDKSSADSSSSSSSAESKLLYEEKPEDVQSIAVTNSEGEYEITQVDSETWTINELSGLPLDKTVLSGIASAVSSVTAQKVIEEGATDLSQYGLADPVADVKVTFKDSKNTVKELLIGNPTPTSGQSYFAFRGDDTIYTVSTSTFSSLEKGKNAAIDSTLLKAPGQDESYPGIDSINVQRADLDYNVKLVYDSETEQTASSSPVASASNDYGHIMVEPINAKLNEENSTKFVRGMFGLKASKIMLIHPTPEDMTSAGMDSPTAVITMVSQGKTYKLTIGAAIASTGDIAAGYYGYVDGTDILFEYNAADLPWLGIDPVTLTSTLISGITIFDLERMDVITPNKTIKFDISGESNDDLVIKKDGVEMDGDYFKKFYTFVLVAPGESIYLEKPTSTTPDIKIVFTTDDGDVSTLEFYNTDNRQSIIVYNGKPSYKCRTAYVERFLSNMAQLETKGEINQNW